MKTNTTIAIASLALSIIIGGPVLADNPIVQTIYTADPAPIVRDGVCYVFTSHDEDELVDDFFTMKDWRCYSSTDMVNWTDHGVVASLRDFAWAAPELSGWGGFENGAWAPHAIERDGKWFLYLPLHGRGIGVLQADNPFGPYTDPIGKPLIEAEHDAIDPAAFIDDDGQAYLYWGNPKAWYVKLNDDMVSYDTSVGDDGLIVLDMTVEAFGERSDVDERRPTSYEEGPWLYKRDDLYYLFFAAGPIPEHLGYSTGPSAVGPWTYGGVVMPTQGGAFTNHPGVVDYKGKTYLFYHNAALPGGGGFHRSVSVEELTFGTDGSVPQINMSEEGPAPIEPLNPYARVEAETICWTGGVETEPCSEGGMNVTAIHDGDFIKVAGVDFGSGGASRFTVRVASAGAGGKIELRLGSLDGELVGTCSISDTGGWQTWTDQSCDIEGATGSHDLYLTFKGGDDRLFNINWWTFAD